MGRQVLEGLTGIRLIGTVGPPQGLVTDPTGRVAYVRSAAAAAAAVVSGGSDLFTYAGYDGFRGENAPTPVSTAVELMFPPFAQAMSSTRSVTLAAGTSAALFPTAAAADLCPSPACTAYIISPPSRGALSGIAGNQILVLKSAMTVKVPCATGSKGWAAPATLMFTPAVGGGSDNYTTVGLIMCGPQGRLTQTVHIAVSCAAGLVANTAGSCLPCAVGAQPSTRGSGLACALCPPGYYRPIITISTGAKTNATNAITTTTAASANSKASTSSSLFANKSNTTNNNVSEMCISCPAGFYAASPGLGECSACPAGTYSAAPGAAACAACPVGTYGPGGGVPCVDCGSVTFGPVPGLSACLSCPTGTVTQSRRAQSAVQCECMEGTYLLSALRGQPCRQCPTGAYCEGNQLPPVVRDHFWTSPEV